MDLDLTLIDVKIEVRRALIKFGDFASTHEAYAVILEELDELWTEIKKKQGNRDFERMRYEALQVGAMAIKLVMFIDSGDARRDR